MGENNMKKPIPVIIDTDIGSDIDDSWALAMALKSPEIDVKLVTVTEFDVEYQAKLAAKMLQIAGRSDIPVGIGISSGHYENNCYIRDWVEDYDLSTYPNVREDGVQALIDTIMESDEKVTILAIGAFRNLAAAVEREPRIKEKSKILGICANIYNGAFKGMNWYPPLGRERPPSRCRPKAGCTLPTKASAFGECGDECPRILRRCRWFDPPSRRGQSEPHPQIPMLPREPILLTIPPPKPSLPAKTAFATHYRTKHSLPHTNSCPRGEPYGFAPPHRGHRHTAWG